MRKNKIILKFKKHFFEETAEIQKIEGKKKKIFPNYKNEIKLKKIDEDGRKDRKKMTGIQNE